MRTFLFAALFLGVISFFRVRRRWRESQEAARSAGSGRGARVMVDDAGIALNLADDTKRIAWPDVQSVHIESVAGGLNADDVYWVLTPARGATPLRVAQTAPGADSMIARLQQLPGFRYEPMINSMITTEATRFLVWEREG
jgi:hypothetical protein